MDCFGTQFRSTNCHNCTLRWTKEDTVHINRLRLHTLRSVPKGMPRHSPTYWQPPSFEHSVCESEDELSNNYPLEEPSTSRPTRTRRVPDRYAPYVTLSLETSS